MTTLIQTFEALLFVSSKPLSLTKLAQLLDVKKAEVAEAVEALAAQYANRKGGVVLVQNGEQVQLVSSPETAETISTFLKDETTGELTRPSLETLTIIAYRGPVTKPEIEQIRGVNCSLILRNLLMRGLVEVAEDKKLMQPTYRVSMDFLKYLGVGSVGELPDYKKLAAHPHVTEMLAAAAEVADVGTA